MPGVPEEIIDHVLSYLDDDDDLRASSLCSRLFANLARPKHWRVLVPVQQTLHHIALRRLDEFIALNSLKPPIGSVPLDFVQVLDLTQFSDKIPASYAIQILRLASKLHTVCLGINNYTFDPIVLATDLALTRGIKTVNVKADDHMSLPDFENTLKCAFPDLRNLRWTLDSWEHLEQLTIPPQVSSLALCFDRYFFESSNIGFGTTLLLFFDPVHAPQYWSILSSSTVTELSFPVCDISLAPLITTLFGMCQKGLKRLSISFQGEDAYPDYDWPDMQHLSALQSFTAQSQCLLTHLDMLPTCLRHLELLEQIPDTVILDGLINKCERFTRLETFIYKLIPYEPGADHPEADIFSSARTSFRQEELAVVECLRAAAAARNLVFNSGTFLL